MQNVVVVFVGVANHEARAIGQLDHQAGVRGTLQSQAAERVLVVEADRSGLDDVDDVGVVPNGLRRDFRRTNFHPQDAAETSEVVVHAIQADQRTLVIRELSEGLRGAGGSARIGDVDGSQRVDVDADDAAVVVVEDVVDDDRLRALDEHDRAVVARAEVSGAAIRAVGVEFKGAVGEAEIGLMSFQRGKVGVATGDRNVAAAVSDVGVIQVRSAPLTEEQPAPISLDRCNGTVAGRIEGAARSAVTVVLQRREDHRQRAIAFRDQLRRAAFTFDSGIIELHHDTRIDGQSPAQTAGEHAAGLRGAHDKIATGDRRSARRAVVDDQRLEIDAAVLIREFEVDQRGRRWTTRHADATRTDAIQGFQGRLNFGGRSDVRQRNGCPCATDLSAREMGGCGCSIDRADDRQRVAHDRRHAHLFGIHDHIELRGRQCLWEAAGVQDDQSRLCEVADLRRDGTSDMADGRRGIDRTIHKNRVADDVSHVELFRSDLNSEIDRVEVAVIGNERDGTVHIDADLQHRGVDEMRRRNRPVSSALHGQNIADDVENSHLFAIDANEEVRRGDAAIRRWEHQGVRDGDVGLDRGGDRRRESRHAEVFGQIRNGDAVGERGRGLSGSTHGRQRERS